MHIRVFNGKTGEMIGQYIVHALSLMSAAVRDIQVREREGGGGIPSPTSHSHIAGLEGKKELK
jgi:hypothetical protein